MTSVDIAAAHAEWDELWDDLSDDVHAVTTEAPETLLACEVDGAETGRVHEPVVSSRHRLWLIDAEPTHDVERQVRDDLLSIRSLFVQAQERRRSTRAEGA